MAVELHLQAQQAAAFLEARFVRLLWSAMLPPSRSLALTISVPIQRHLRHRGLRRLWHLRRVFGRLCGHGGRVRQRDGPVPAVRRGHVQSIGRERDMHGVRVWTDHGRPWCSARWRLQVALGIYQFLNHDTGPIRQCHEHFQCRSLDLG
jgi:hypothetical protein